MKSLGDVIRVQTIVFWLLLSINHLLLILAQIAKSAKFRQNRGFDQLGVEIGL